ncbi:GntR family transcriptional regulator [Gimesia aquarii]|uniref:HTH-type transcriptional regulator LutR n=1 Tax=Gimesia aquarii TaxID=2527964 RepID=A0A517VX82_9PLAN|nr:GntR family transcriptional regulator [Gimesia aquarii]QDT97609.1 HTH-type transcriptional regulator LutR [Gimesia aquarii]
MNTTGLNAQIKRTSLVDAVYESLLEAIVSGGLAPGAELNSVELAQQLEVSRTPVKEAIKLLIHDGLVEQVNNHKARVAQFTSQDICEIYELREQLEGAAVEKVTQSIDEKVLNQLRSESELLLQTYGELSWASKAVNYDIRFHTILATESGNRRLLKEIMRYRLLVRGFCRMTGSEETLLQALKEHIVIIEAIESREPLLARQAMVSHIQARKETVLEQLFTEE